VVDRGALFKFLTGHNLCSDTPPISTPVVRLGLKLVSNLPPRREDQNANNKYQERR
jgi:hypothetical protein